MHFGRLAAITMSLAFLGAPAYAASAPTSHQHSATAPHKKHDAKKHSKKHAKKTPPKGGHQR